ncbi:MAG: hypothetical protein Ta2G_18440 [Termitinemataceae bacterium]|nr:MAG: hypothetical protein Ta2G_18440 [Termitinemataceae bacterium]
MEITKDDIIKMNDSLGDIHDIEKTKRLMIYCAIFYIHRMRMF